MEVEHWLKMDQGYMVVLTVKLQEKSCVILHPKIYILLCTTHEESGISHIIFISTSVGACAQMYFVDFMVVVITVTNTLLA